MSNVKTFPDGVAEKIGNYVYRLIDPRNGETFYVGKGKGNRIFSHVNTNEEHFIKDAEDDKISLKFDRIREIKNAGLEVLHVIHRHDIPDVSVFEVEAAVMDAYPGLSNIQGGHDSGSKGPMSVTEINDKYALPVIDAMPEEKLVLININWLKDRKNKAAIYKQTHLAWRISKARAQKADYVLSVVRGVIVGAFKANEWFPATSENFEEITTDTEMPERMGFKGDEAPKAVWDKFVGERGKRIEVDEMKHIRFPIRYCNI